MKERINWAHEMLNNFTFSDECSKVIGADIVDKQKMRKINLGLT